MLGSTASEQGNLSKKYDEKHKKTKTIWNIFAYYFTIYLFTTNNWIVCDDHFRVRSWCLFSYFNSGISGKFPFLLIWRLKKKKSWDWSFVFSLFATYVVYQILGNFWARYAHLINHRNIHDEYFTVLFSNGQPTFLSTILSFVLPVIIGPVFEETLDRGYFMNTFFP